MITTLKCSICGRFMRWGKEAVQDPITCYYNPLALDPPDPTYCHKSCFEKESKRYENLNLNPNSQTSALPRKTL